MTEHGMTERELYLMRWAYDVGACDGKGLLAEQAVFNAIDDVISGSGHKAHQLLNHLAPADDRAIQLAAAEKERDEAQDECLQQAAIIGRHIDDMDKCAMEKRGMECERDELRAKVAGLEAVVAEARRIWEIMTAADNLPWPYADQMEDTLSTEPKVLANISGGAFDGQLEHLKSWPWGDGYFRLYPTTKIGDPVDDDEIDLVPVRVIVQASHDEAKGEG